jgi:hypothetical protein
MKNKEIYSRLGWLALLISFLISCTTLYYGAFVDEADNLVVGLLMTQGYVLYQDIFSHHFPFTYYWTATIIGLFGKSILTVRLSTLLFRIISFAIAMKFSRFQLSLGLTSLAWSLVGPLYKGNMVLYSIFGGISLVVIFSITLAVIGGQLNETWKPYGVIGVFSIIAVLSDPLSVYAVGIAIVFTAMMAPKQAATMGLLIAVSLSFYLGYLFVSETFTDFIKDTIYFNLYVYGKYDVDTNPVRFWDFLKIFVRGLALFSTRWLDLDPGKEVFSRLEYWIFTGFLYRLSLLLLTLFFVIQRKYLAALFVYCYAVALLLISETGFRATGFIMVALFAAAELSVGQWLQQQVYRIRRWFPITARILVGSMALWLVVRAATHLFSEPEFLAYKINFRPAEIKADLIMSELGNCGLSQVSLAYYPGDPYMYWFTGMRPVSKYIYMWPWVAEVAIPEVINSLDKGSSLVYIDNVTVWKAYKTKDYLLQLHEYLEERYVKVAEGWYISPDLSTRCYNYRK